MLYEFKIENHRSFAKAQALNLEASSLSEHRDRLIKTKNETLILPVIAIYGANSSGKSNIFKAMRTMRKMILKNNNSVDDLPYEPFLLHVDNVNKPTLFEMTFGIDDIKYRYGFRFNKDAILEEWLFKTKKIKETFLFLRVGNEFKISPNFKEGKDLKNRTRENALFLNIADQFNGKISHSIMEWFKKLTILFGIEHRSFGSKSRHMMLNESSSIEQKNQLFDFFSKMDLGFERIDVKKREFEISDFPELNLPDDVKNELITNKEKLYTLDLNTIHKQFNSNNTDNFNEVAFSQGQESVGTEKVIDLAGEILEAIRNGGVLVVDELDSSLHLLITIEIIKLFNSKESNNNNAQLIFNTHSTSILSNCELRRDQIFFTEKDRFTETMITSLAEYKIRKDRSCSFEKDYINGRYGGIPLINSIISNFATLDE